MEPLLSNSPLEAVLAECKALCLVFSVQRSRKVSTKFPGESFGLWRRAELEQRGACGQCVPCFHGEMQDLYVS